MQSVNNPFEQQTGANRLQSPLMLAMMVGATGIAAVLTAKMGLLAGLAFLGLPLIAFYLYMFFRMPEIGLYSSVALSFLLLGIGRYVKGVPVGLVLDAMLIFTYIALFFNRFREKIDWSPARKDITLLAAIWFLYSLLQILNPEARSFAAWFSGRGIGLYLFLLAPLTLLFIDDERKLNLFFYLWAGFSILVTLKGLMQLYVGVDPWEKAWLNEGNYKTHILFGKLRVFSFLSDAGQFGANQAFTGVVMTIFSMSMKGWRKLFFLSIGMLALYGMVISGTRGAMSIPIVGFTLFFVLRKNKGVMITGFFVLLAVFYFFKFTTIGQGNYQIRRMRTAFDTNDASFQVRLENQKKLKTYMATRPFGGGIGHGGVKAQKYLPNAYLSQIPTDSGYVLIWVEMGVVGLVLLLLILFYVIGKSSFLIMFRIRDPNLKLKMTALTSGMMGIMVANYGNAVLNQMPTSVLFYVSMALLMNMKSFDDKLQQEQKSKVLSQ